MRIAHNLALTVHRFSLLPDSSISGVGTTGALGAGAPIEPLAG